MAYAYSIEWDVDEEERDCLPHDVELPDDIQDEDDAFEYLSDNFGWTVLAADIELDV